MLHLRSLLCRGLFAALLVVSGCLLGATSVQAHGTSVGDLVIDHPYATPSLKGVNTAGVYFRGIKNQGDKDDRLLSATTTVAGRVAMHHMAMDGTVMRMREVPAIALPANSNTFIRHKSGEYHMMLLDLKQPLKNGDRFDITFTFERAGKQTVNVWVQTPRDMEQDDHQH
jgi:copper(I)-binding protein